MSSSASSSSKTSIDMSAAVLYTNSSFIGNSKTCSSKLNPNNKSGGNSNTGDSCLGLKRNRAHVLRSLNCVHFDKVVGSGTFGVVYKATEKDTGEHVALKKIKMERETQGFPITAIREIKILKALNHENIVSLKEILIYDAEVDAADMSAETAKNTGLVSGDIFMMFEFCDFDLSGLLRSPSVTLSEQHIKSYMKQLLYGVAYMHKNKILHRDIKGANILVTRGNVVKIADWGLARSYYNTNDQRLTNPVVTQWYRCPELLLESHHYGSEVDIWSIGCLFAEMKSTPRVPLFPGKDNDGGLNQLELIYQLLGTPPRDSEVAAEYEAIVRRNGKDPAESLHAKISRPYLNRLSKKFNTFDNHALQLLEQLLELHPKKRISAEAALDSEYFWNDPAPLAEDLQPFTVDAAFSMSEDERMRAEYAAKQEEMAKAMQQQRMGMGMPPAGIQNRPPYGQQYGQQQMQQQQSGGGRVGGRSVPGGHSGSGSGRGPFPGRGARAPMPPSKYSIAKPGAAAAAAAVTAGSSTSVSNGASRPPDSAALSK